MSISAALSNANSGLAAASRRASVVSNNVANALTPGYSRREVSVSQRVLDGQGAGVVVSGVTRAVDPALTSERRSAEASLAKEQLAASTFADFNRALGEPGDAFSLFNQYQNLESSLRSLAETPESQPQQEQVLANAKALAASFNNLSNNAQSARKVAEASIAQQVQYVNATLIQIDKLNDQISLASAGGRDATALEDQRALLIDEVSRIIPIREVVRGNNKLDLITHEGVFLLAGDARKIQFTPANSITPAASIANGELSGLSVEGTDLTPGSGGSTTPRQGSMAGLFAIRDEIAPSFQSKLDGLARDVIERFEAIDPTLNPGDPGLFTDNGSALDPSFETGLAGRIAINAIVDPDQGGQVWRIRDGFGASVQGPSGNAEFIRTMLESLTALKSPPANTGVGGEVSAINAVANVTSAIGASRISAETSLAAISARTQSVLDAENAATAVDTDQELQKLLVIEQAYAANARVIQTVDRLLQNLLEL